MPNFINVYRLLFIITLSVIIISCGNDTATGINDGENDRILAKVGDKALYWSSLEQLVPQISADMDTAVFVSSMINKWVADQLMIQEAEKTKPSDLDIEELLREYRASLLLFNYETRLVEELLDTVVTLQQKKDYYNTSKEQYLLPEALLKFRLAKLDKGTKQLDKFYNSWKKSEWANVNSFIRNNDGVYINQSENWITLSEFSAYLPENFLKGKVLKKDFSLRQTVEGDEYYIIIEDYISENEAPPFEYIEGKIVKVILNNRKSEIINRKKKQLFEKGYASKMVKIYYPD